MQHGKEIIKHTQYANNPHCFKKETPINTGKHHTGYEKPFFPLKYFKIKVL